MVDLKDRLTVFVISAGFNPNYVDCIKALEKQTVKFNIDIIKDYNPMHVAFQEMINRCKTDYYVEIDEDMILMPMAIEMMYNTISTVDEKCAMVGYKLHDFHINFNIYGVKIYKHNIFKNYPYNNNTSVSCEMEQLQRIKDDGYTYQLFGDILGEHSPKWTEELIFERYFNLMEKYKEFGYSWLEEVPRKLWKLFQENPSKLNLSAMLGAYTSISSEKKLLKGEKSFIAPQVEGLVKMDSYLEFPKWATFYLTNRCNYRCKYCALTLGTIDHMPDMTFAKAVETMDKFPSIQNVTLCFTGDTKVKLVDGSTKTFEELVSRWKIDKKPFYVYSRNAENKIVPSLAKDPRIIEYVDSILEITLDNNKKIKCTQDHLFMLKDGSYKKAIDLTVKDSLMPLYIVYKKCGAGNGVYEYIKDFGNSGFTHRLFAESYFGNVEEKVIHHKDFNPLNNDKENLAIITNSEHAYLHRMSPGGMDIFSIARDRWNGSVEGKKHLLKHNKSAKQKKIVSEKLKKWKHTEEGVRQTYRNLDKMNTREVMLKNNTNPENIKNRQRGKIITIIKNLLKNNLEINEENFNSFASNGYPKYDKINRCFSGVDEAIKNSIGNHKIISKKLIKLKKKIPVYCMEVEKYHNFALESGVFVKNCGYGDPFLCRDLFPIIDMLKSRKKYVGLITNGSLLEKKLSIIGNSIPDYISISLNGSNAQTHLAVTGVDDFETVLRGIRKCVSMGILTYLSYICTKENWKDVKPFIKLAKELKVSGVHLHNLLPHFDSIEDGNFWDLVFTVHDKHLIDEMKKDENADIVLRYPVLIEKGVTRTECRSPWRLMNVDGAGNVGGCLSVAAPQKIDGNIADINVWHNPYFEDLRKSLFGEQKDMCAKCFRNWKFD